MHSVRILSVLTYVVRLSNVVPEENGCLTGTQIGKNFKNVFRWVLLVLYSDAMLCFLLVHHTAFSGKGRADRYPQQVRH